MSRFDDFTRMVSAETDQCIPWTFDSTDYPSVMTGGILYRVHVLACERANGPRPTPAHEAAHNCGVSSCFNPRHLRWATHAENQGDRLAHGTGNRGERHGSCKLTRSQVDEIRSLVRQGHRQKDVARRFGVSPSTVSSINIGANWKWLSIGLAS